MVVTWLLIGCLLTVLIGLAIQQHDEEFTDGYLVEFHDLSPRDVEKIADQHGFVVDDVIDGLDLYHVVPKNASARRKRSDRPLRQALILDNRVISAARQRVLVREKRDIIHGKPFHVPVRRVSDKSIYHRVNVDRARIIEKDHVPNNDHINFHDPYFRDEWYISNDGQTGGRPGVDMNVVKAWKAGYTGRGVVVCILDDGIDYTHPDLSANYDAFASTDLNDRDNAPYPRDDDPSNSHGTRCAGEVAAAANNSVCGVGVAYEAKIAGIRLLDGKITDHLEAKGLLYRCNHTDIFSASWGPRDDGRTMEAPQAAARRALEHGVKYGRNGLGVIYVWATGNGGLTEDDCNADGYVSSIETLSIGSITDRGERPYFMELCPSTMAVVPTGGATRLTDVEMETKPKIKVVTTDLHHDCTLEFQGTSSAAPLGAACIALSLQANPRLTWRDVQHIVARSARIPGVTGTWTINGAGLHLSTFFGFGVMDCTKMVTLARDWLPVPRQKTCIITKHAVQRTISSGETVSMTLRSDACVESRNHIDQLEHVQLFIRATHSHRGDMRIFLTSPQGMRSEMLSPRPNDAWDKTFNFTFMTVRSWGEIAKGDWLLEISDSGDGNGRTNKGQIIDVSLIMHGYESNKVFDSSKKARDLNHSQARDLMEFERQKARLLVVPSFSESPSKNGYEEVRNFGIFADDFVKLRNRSGVIKSTELKNSQEASAKVQTPERDSVENFLDSVSSEKRTLENEGLKNKTRIPRRSFIKKIIRLIKKYKFLERKITNRGDISQNDSNSHVCKRSKHYVEKIIDLIRKFQHLDKKLLELSESKGSTKKMLSPHVQMHAQGNQGDLNPALEKVKKLLRWQDFV